MKKPSSSPFLSLRRSPIGSCRRLAEIAAAIVLAGAFGSLSCATGPAPVPVTEPQAAAPDPRLQPTFVPAPVATAEVRRDRRIAERREILDAAWRTVRDVHYDPRLGGIDWEAVRRRYEPLALAAPSDAAFYRVLNDMVGELGQSHMMVTGPGADDEPGPPALDAPAPDAPPGMAAVAPAAPGATRATAAAATPRGPEAAPAQIAAAPSPPLRAAPPAPAAGGAGPPSNDPVVVIGVGDPGLTVRAIEGRPTVTGVRPGSSAARHRIAPGYLITRIAGRPLLPVPNSHRPLRPVEERFALRRAATHLLQGPAGSKVTVDYLDNDDRPGQVILDRDPAAGPVRQIGHLPPLHPETRISQIGNVGVIAFNIFLLDPLLPEIQRAIERFRIAQVKGIILDLRGNPGGLGAMAIPIASDLVSAAMPLGTLQFRTFSQSFKAQPSLGRTPYTGPLAILTDEGTASASEILAAGLQEAGRARVVGDTTLGAVLPSLIQALPHGAVMQVVVADFRTPKGILVEGRGVQPDRRVLETRAAWRAGRDPVIDAALAVLKTAPAGSARR